MNSKIGEKVRIEWKKVRLGEICEFKYGKGLPERNRIIGEFPVYGSGGMVDYHNEYLVKGPGIIVGRKGTIGSVFFEKRNFYPIDTVFYVEEVKEITDKKFLYYVLLNLKLDKLNSDAAVPGLNRNVAYQQQVVFSPLSTQRKIAAILSAYDDLIENNNRRIKILEEMAQAIYKEWFVSFRFPGHEKVKMVKSEIGKIPTGCIVKRLGDCVKLSNGKSIKPDNIGQFPVYGSNGIIGTSNKHNFENGVIIGRVGAYCGSINRCRTNFWASDNTIVALPISHSFGMPFIYYLLQHMELNKHAGGSAQPLLTQATLNKLLVIAPPCDLFNQFDIVAGNILVNIDIITKKTSNLRKTRDLLLPKLISGEIDVENMDIKVNKN